MSTPRTTENGNRPLWDEKGRLCSERREGRRKPPGGAGGPGRVGRREGEGEGGGCLLYTSDAADDTPC
eukprot:4900908-Pyramimonas_sp.AAC.1